MAKKQAKKQTEKSEPVSIQPIKTRRLQFCIVGKTPLIMHRFALKAWQELLYPSAKKNAAERAATLKHNPTEEYRGCFYRNRDPKTPALFHIPNGMFHQSLAAAALDMPGATRAAMERLTTISTPNINFFGIPFLSMMMVRNSDQNHTPDVRTRPIFPRWACSFEIEYKIDPLTDAQIVNLLGVAGVIVGCGDWRPQKKGGAYGKYRIANPGDKEFADIVAREGRAAQQKAYDNPVCYDQDTEELLAWFDAEVARRRQEDDQPQQDGDGMEVIQ